MPVDAVEEWSRAQQRVIDLVADLPPERAELRVPACPDWTVRDLFSHMVGLGVDVVAGDEVRVSARERPIRFIEPRGALPFWELLRRKAELLPT